LIDDDNKCLLIQSYQVLLNNFSSNIIAIDLTIKLRWETLI